MNQKNHQKVLWITTTAVLLALLVAGQAVTKGLGQFVTGSWVNAVLAVVSLLGGMSCGIVVAVISPMLAFLLGIAPQAVTVPAIMVGNTVFVVLLRLLYGKDPLRQVAAWLAAALAKCVVLFVLVAKIICGVASAPLLENGMLKAPMLQKLPAMFSWPQLVTALIGGGLAIVIVPLLKKALKK